MSDEKNPGQGVVDLNVTAPSQINKILIAMHSDGRNATEHFIEDEKKTSSSFAGEFEHGFDFEYLRPGHFYWIEVLLFLLSNRTVEWSSEQVYGVHPFPPNLSIFSEKTEEVLLRWKHTENFQFALTFYLG